MGDLSKNFSRSEFACQCGCGLDDVDLNLISRLQRLRDFLERPIQITSGVRCPSHNRTLGGASTSAHLEEKAADISVTSSGERYELLTAVTEFFDRIGVAEDFVHVDIRPTVIPVMWTY